MVEAFCLLTQLPRVICIGTNSNQEVIPYGIGKVKVLEDVGVKEWYAAFGNSEGDKEMLDHSIVSILRNPSEDSLIEYGKEHNWIII